MQNSLSGMTPAREAGQSRRDLLARSVGAAAVGALAAPAWASPPARGFADRLLAAARAQVGVTTRYEPAYVRISYPGGDVPRVGGVCTDVVIRAYRDAFGVDLQKLVHGDIAAHRAAYPTRWGLAHADSNIDHRRVPNLQAFFARHGAALPVTREVRDWRPGDLATALLPGGLPHIMIVAAAPQVIHNIGGGARIEDRLFESPLTGHYRWVPPGVAA